VAGVRVGAPEALDAGGLAEDLRGRERLAAADREQRRSKLLDKGADLPLEPVDLGRYGTAAIEELRRYPRDCPVDVSETVGKSIEVAKVIQRPEGWFVTRVELVRMPAKTADHAGSLADQVLTVVAKQPHLTLGPVQPGDRQVGLAQGSRGDGESVDRVALAKRAGRAARLRHQLRRHAHDPRSGGEQVSLESAREGPAILDRPRRARRRSATPSSSRRVVRLCASRLSS